MLDLHLSFKKLSHRPLAGELTTAKQLTDLFKSV